MDPQNERKIFEFVLAVSSNSKVSQYLLITPKVSAMIWKPYFYTFKQMIKLKQFTLFILFNNMCILLAATKPVLRWRFDSVIYLQRS